jgi:hypothetical protein
VTPHAIDEIARSMPSTGENVLLPLSFQTGMQEIGNLALMATFNQLEQRMSHFAAGTT